MNNRFRKSFGTLLLTVIVACSFSLSAFAKEDETTFADIVAGEISTLEIGDYTIIEIASEEELKTLADNCRLDSWSVNKYVKLTEDISLTEYKGLTVASFGGIFDGNGHTISGICLTVAGSDYGFFRYIQKSGVVKNLVVKGVTKPELSANNVGLLCGINYGQVDSCEAIGSVTGNNNVGAIAGNNAKGGSINKCTVQSYVTGNHSVGGVVGLNDGYVSDCENKGYINTNATDVAVDVSEISVESITAVNSTSNVAVFTDVGGIAGVSTGSITDCVNRGDVGYSHVGYNIGGIAGRISQGYVTNCENYGNVLGRKDVGGIAGQMEPFLQVQYLSDGLTQLDAEVSRLFDLIDEAANDAQKYSDQTSALLSDISDSLLEANNISKELPSDDGETSIEQMQSQLDSMTSSLISLQEDIDIIARYSDRLSDLVKNSSDEMNSDIRAITNQARRVTNLASAIRNDILSYQGIEFGDNSFEAATPYEEENPLADKEDNSSEESEGEELQNVQIEDSTYIDVENITEDYADETDYEVELVDNMGRLVACVNYGSVNADSAVGGIVGRIATEYDIDPEDDISLSGASSLYVSATARAVVRDCKNYANIYAKKDYAGGIAGYAKYGYLISNVSTADIESETGSYIGGIAGISESSIVASHASGILSGKSYIGGIVGSGRNVSGSASYVTLEYTGEKIGSIAGSISEEGVISENYYVTCDEGGIDGVGYLDGACPVDYEEFCKIEGLPAEFTNFRIIFLADGNQIGEKAAKYGDSLNESDIPEIPEKEGYYGMWPEMDFSFITGNRVLEAQYEKYNGAIVSDDTIEIDGKQKALLLLVGDFLPGAELKLAQDDDEYQFSIIYPSSAKLAQSRGITEYTDEVKVRIALEETDDMQVEIYDGTDWKEVPSNVIGSYLEFTMDAPGRFRVMHVVDYAMIFEIIIISAVVLSIIVLIIVITRVRKLRRKLALKKTPKAVIFDLDGTIIDTEKYYRRVWPAACEHFGYHLTDEQTLELRSLGRPFAPKKFEEWFGPEFDYAEVRSYRKELFEELVNTEGVHLKPGVKDLLDALKEKGITIAIATATDTERTKRYLDMVGIYGYFDKICSAANVKEGKPSPDVYLQACKQLGIMPESCFAVEDAPNGVKSASKAGCRVIFVPDQTKDEPDIEGLCFAKVNTADEIISLI